MAFKNCKLSDDELRKYEPGYPWLQKEFIPTGGTIDRENDIRLFKYGNGPVREPSDLYQFIFDYKGTPLKVQLRQELKGNDVYWRNCQIECVNDFKYDYDEVKQVLRDAMKVYAYVGFTLPQLMKKNDQLPIHIEF